MRILEVLNNNMSEGTLNELTSHTVESCWFDEVLTRVWTEDKYDVIICYPISDAEFNKVKTLDKLRTVDHNHLAIAPSSATFAALWSEAGLTTIRPSKALQYVQNLERSKDNVPERG